MSYLKVSEATLIKQVGVNPIYYANGTYYVGIETLGFGEEEVENCIDCNTLEEAEQECANLPQPPFHY